MNRLFHGVFLVLLASLVAEATPSVDQQPENVTVVSGGSSVFSSSATGNGALSYQWEVSSDGGSNWSMVADDSIYSGVTSRELSLETIPLGFHDRRYRVRITDVDGGTISEEAVLTVEYTELWGMGSNLYGQLGTGEFGYHPTPEQIGTDYQKVIARGSSSLFLKPDGTLWASGFNSGGQLHDGTTTNRSTPVQIASGVTEAASNGYSTLFLKADNTLWGVGQNNTGQLGLGHQIDQEIPVQIATDVVQFAAGGGHSLFIKTDGTLWGMGRNPYGQLGVYTWSLYQTTPIQIGQEVAKVYAGPNHSLFVKTDGTLWGMGPNSDGQLGSDFSGSIETPTQIATDVSSAAIGRYHTLYLKTDGTLWSMGQNSFGQLGDGTTTNRSTPSQVASGVNFVTASFYGSYFIKSDHTLWGMGENESGQLGDGTLEHRSTPVEVASEVSYVSAGRSHLMFKKLDGSTWAAGRDGYGEFGVGRTSNAREPILIADSVISYSAGYHHSLFVKSDGSLWAMGENSDGQLGDETTENRARPTHIMDEVADVAAGYSFSHILKTDGSLWGMGSNDRGQLGVREGLTWTSTPTPIADNVRKVFGGYYHSLFLKADDTLWGMGLNTSGQLGDGTTTNRFTPIQMLSDVATATSGSSFTLAALNDGTLMAAGRNFGGVFGNGLSDSSTHTTLTEISDSPSILALASGSSHSLFLHSDHTLWAAGSNGYGQLGRGFIGGSEPIPAQVATDVVEIAASSSSSLFVKSDGTLWGMGFDGYAPFSPESVLYTDTPTQLTDGVLSASAGPGHHLFLKRGVPEAPVVLGQSGDLHRAYGESAVMEVSFSGFPTPMLQWKKDGTDIAGKNSAQLGISYSKPDDAGSYVLVISNSLGTVESDPIILTVDDAIAATITSHPVGAYQVVGGSHTLEVEVTGTAPLSYQWKKDGNTLEGETGKALELSNLQLADAGSYTVTITNPVHSIMSNAAILDVETRPQIISASSKRIIGEVGEVLNISVSATSVYAPLIYQWKRNNRPISGATSANFTLPNFTNADAGAYTLEITDAHGYMTRHTSFVLPDYEQTQVIAWGGSNNETPESSIDIPDVVAVASSYSRTFILLRDGSVLSRDALNGEIVNVDGANDIVAITAYNHSGFFLRADGTVRRYWRDSYGHSSPSEFWSETLDVTDAIAVASGSKQLGALILKSDGTVDRAAWGSVDLSEEYMLPSELSDVASIAAGAFHGLALKIDGTVVAWGANDYGQSNVPSGLADVETISAGLVSSAAVKHDGTVIGWGDTFGGVIDALASLSSIESISLSHLYAAAVKSDGTLMPVAMEPSDGLSPMPMNLSPVIAVAAEQLPIVIIRESSGDAGPVIVKQPAAGTVYSHDDFTLAVTAEGMGPFYYQWRKDGVNLPDEIEASLNLSDLSLADAGAYDVIVTTHAGSVTSDLATLTIIPLPEVTIDAPARQVQTPGDEVSLTASATGAGVIHYQWYRDTQEIDGATQATFTIPSGTVDDSGAYWLKVTDDNGTNSSDLSFVLIAPEVTEIRGWGRNSSQQLEFPEVNTDSIAIAAGVVVAISLQRDGTVLTRGSTAESPPEGLDDVVAVAAGISDFLLLHEDGTVSALGSSTTVPAGLNDVVKIYANDSYFAAIKKNGTVVAWISSGNASYVPDGLTGVKTVSQYGSRWEALLNDGTIVTWHRYDESVALSGIIGLDNIAQAEAGVYLKVDGSVGGYTLGEWVPREGLSNVVSISQYLDHTLALKADGSVVAWGANAFGETDVPDDRVGGTFALSAGSQFSLILRDPTLDSAPVIVAHPVDVVTGGDHPVATFDVTVDGSGSFSYQWRKDGVPIEGATDANLVLNRVNESEQGSYDVVVSNYLGETTSSEATLTVVAPAEVSIQGLTSHILTPGDGFAVSATASGATPLASYQWYHNGWPIPEADGMALSLTECTVHDSGYYVLAVIEDYGTTRSAPVFVTVAPLITQIRQWGAGSIFDVNPYELTDIVSVAAGDRHSLALRRDGSVFGWGLNQYGQSAGMPPSSPAVVRLIAGIDKSFAIRSDGSVIGWGVNEEGKLDIPSDLINVVQITEGSGYMVALKSDGELVMWGAGAAIVSDAAPIDLQDVVAVDAGATFIMALKSDGTVVSWGSNTFDETGFARGLNDVTAIAAGSFFSIALKSNGTVVAWGNNSVGQTDVPAGLSDVIAISAGRYHASALKSDGTVVSWGENYANATIPPPELSDVFALTSGTRYTIAIRDADDDVLPVIAAHPVSKMVGYGETAAFSVSATGYPVTYLWRHDIKQIFGATANTYLIENVTFDDAGRYDVVVYNSRGGEVSFAATLTVTANAQSWIAEHFSPYEIANTGIDGPTADPDGDGLTNLLEYALGLDPRSPDTTGLPEMSTTATDWVYTYTRPADRTDITYEVEMSTDLSGWTSNSVTHQLLNSNDVTETWQASAPLSFGDSVFFRLKIVQ